MAFTAAGTSQGAELIRQQYVPGFVEGVFTNNELAQHFPAPEDSGGDTAYRWKLHTAANDSVEIFTEGQAQPDAGEQGWASGAVSHIHYRGMLQITGHARDAMRSNWVNGIEEEATQLRVQLVDLITNTWLSAANSGLLVAVDSTTTYAGQTRGAITWFESYETAVSDIIGYTSLMTANRTLRDNDVGAKPDLILCPWNQAVRIYNIQGQPAIKQIGPGDAAAGFSNGQIAFAGIPVQPISDLDDNTILILDRSPGNWAHLRHRDWQVKEMAPSGDSDLYQLSYSAIIVCKAPKKQGKLTSCTT